MGFREDINGLRAVAVAAVVLYHFQLGLAPGGFSGVDVFFVISGFLMTQIVCGRLAQGRFSLAGFYLARVRRIVPAMVVLVAAILALGTALMNPLQLESLAKSALVSLLFISNISYAHQAGYFATPPDDNWLIHTWSLSVEWQFYIVYPLALMALSRLGARTRGIALAMAAVAIASLALTLLNWRSGGSPLNRGFFFLQGRAWEFLAGGLVAAIGTGLSLPDRARIGLHAAGLTLIAAGIACVDRGTAWPSPMTLLPVAGTSLVLLAGRERAGWARLAPVAALGRWSYSIYLWHWPIVALLAFEGHATPAWALSTWALAGIVLSIACGAASYALVETWLTTRLFESARLGLPFAASLFTNIAGLVILVAATGGLETIRYAERPELLAYLAELRAARTDWAFPKACDHLQWDGATNITRCTFGDAATPDTLVIGDSVAEELAPRFSHALTGTAVTFVTQGGCPPAPGVGSRTPGAYCRRFVDLAYNIAAASPAKRIVVTALWPGYGPDILCLGAKGACTPLDKAAFDVALTAAYARMVDRWRALREAGKEVVVLDVPPYGGGNPNKLYAEAVAGSRVTDLSLPLADFEARTRHSSTRLAAAARAAGASYVDPAPALCPDGRCPIVVDGRTLYKDDVHLRASILKQPRFAIYDALIAPGSGAARSASAAGR